MAACALFCNTNTKVRSYEYTYSEYKKITGVENYYCRCREQVKKKRKLFVCALDVMHLIIKHKLMYYSKAYLSNAVVAKEKAARQDQGVNHKHTSETNTYSFKFRST